MWLLLVSALFIGTVTMAQTNATHHVEDGLLAHDINGYTLDMTVEQAKAISNEPMQSLGHGHFQVKTSDVDYDLNFSILGHLYLIESVQDLGIFTPDATYARTLTEKLTRKFGKPQNNMLPDGPVQWGWSQDFIKAGTPPYSLPTVELSALLLGGYGQPITLHMHLIDFRIERRDLAKANSTPRSKAEAATKF